MTKNYSKYAAEKQKVVWKCETGDASEANTL